MQSRVTTFLSPDRSMCLGSVAEKPGSRGLVQLWFLRFDLVNYEDCCVALISRSWYRFQFFFKCLACNLFDFECGGRRPVERESRWHASHFSGGIMEDPVGLDNM